MEKDYLDENQDFQPAEDFEPMITQEEDYTHGRPLLAFTGPSDLPKEENRRWFMLVITVSLLMIIISLIINKTLLALILIGVAWLTYMLSRLPNQDIENVVTTTGFFSRNKFYPWSQLNGFWIIKDHGYYVLGIETNRRPFAHQMILLGAQNPLEIKQVISQFIPYKEDRKQDSLSVAMEKSAIVLDKFYSGIFNRVSPSLRAKLQKKSVEKKEETTADPIKSSSLEPITEISEEVNDILSESDNKTK